MRVLHVANFSWFSSSSKRADNIARHYATDRKISNGLIRNGCCVYEFSYRDAARYFAPLPFGGKQFGAKKMNQEIERVAAAFVPDLILLGHTELILPPTLAALRRQNKKVKIAQWWVDWFTPRSISHLRAKLPYLDAFFATTAPAHVAPFLNTNTAASPPFYYLPNMVDSGVEIGRGFENESYLYDLFFAGAQVPERAAALDAVRALPNVKCGFFGIDGAPSLGGVALHQAITAAKIGLNLSHAADIPLYSSDRLAQLAGNGCCVVSPRTPQMDTLFGDNEICYFDDCQELPSLIGALLKDDERRRAVAFAGWRRAHSSYNEKRVCRFIVEAAMGDEFGEKYEWINT